MSAAFSTSEERYASCEAYLEKVREVVQQLAVERYVLAEDVDILVSAYAARYEAAMAEVKNSAGHRSSES